MAFTNFDTKEIHAKILYLGAHGSGKTANLRSLLSQSSPEMQSGLAQLGSAPGPTTYFDFLPLSFGQVGNFHLKMHLYTLPSNGLYETTLHMILHGVDGCIFVADSRIEALPDNIETYTATRRLLMDHGYTLAHLPRVVQYNKRDTEFALSTHVLRQELNPTGVPEFEAVATQDQGTMETLQGLASLVIKKLESSPS